jgi:Glycosyl transferase family 2
VNDKRTARERVEELLDPGSFEELDTFVAAGEEARLGRSARLVAGGEAAAVDPDHGRAPADGVAARPAGERALQYVAPVSSRDTGEYLPPPVGEGGQKSGGAKAGLSVVLPAYNEETNIGPMIEACLEVLPKLTTDYEVIVVDDGSRDSSSAVAEEWVQRCYPEVRLLVHDRNLGYGAAIRTGLQHACKPLIFYTDADRQFDVEELTYFLPLAQDHDLVIGFRVYRYDSMLRSAASWAYNRIVAVLFRVRVRDVDCAFKLMRAEVRDKLPLHTGDFFIDTEIVASARRWNFRIAQKGVRHYPRVAGETTVQPSDVLRTLRTIARMWRRIYMPTSRQRREAEETAKRVIAAERTPSTVGS